MFAVSRRAPAAPRRGLFTLLVALIVASTAVGTLVAEPRVARAAGTTTTTALNLRSGPSTSTRVIVVMPAGAWVELTGGTENGFAAVTYRGNTGWAYSQYLSSGGGSTGAAAPSATGTAYTTTSLNLRGGAGTSFGVITVMPSGAAVSLTGSSQNGFASVTYRGTSGWAYAQYLGSSAPAAPAAPSAPAPSAGSGSGSIVDIIYAAADRYGQPRADMLRVAQCESNLIPSAVNRSSGASGLFQFMPGTWATTPYADQDIFSAYASANAAGWMWSVGRRGEWSCQ